MTTNFYLETVLPCGCKATYEKRDGRSQMVPVFSCRNWKRHKYDVTAEERRLGLIARRVRTAIQAIQ